MKEMTKEEQVNELKKMLQYIDTVCRKNNIKYSLLGGSLIGAIRHKGMIPWDDDIDIILKYSEYEKLIKILKNDKDSYYIIFDGKKEKVYWPYTKLINPYTYIVDECTKEIDNYGLFIDIFTYNNTSNNKLLRKIHYKLIEIGRVLITGNIIRDEKLNFLRRIRNILSKLIGGEKLLKYHNKICRIYNKRESTYIVSNWPVYGYSKEIQKREDIENYIDKEFEGMTVMVTKNYDNILRTTFGNYMQLPPESERVNHSIKAYWRK